MMCIGHPNRPHFMQNDGNTTCCNLERSLTSGEAAANHVNWCLNALF
jgi:hypothetical protein